MSCLHLYFCRIKLITEKRYEEMGYMDNSCDRVEEASRYAGSLDDPARLVISFVALLSVLLNHPEKLGMTGRGLRRKILPIRREWKDNYHYAIVEDTPSGMAVSRI
jgi:hypothetical protein